MKKNARWELVQNTRQEGKKREKRKLGVDAKGR